MTFAVHWFRTDLRMHDNLSLAAAQSDGQVVAIYIATPQQWRLHGDAPIKQDYWRRNLEQLETVLEEKNIPLRYFEVRDYAAIPALLQTVLSQWQVNVLHCNREYPLNEHKRDQAVAAVCTRLGIRMRLHEDQLERLVRLVRRDVIERLDRLKAPAG